MKADVLTNNRKALFALLLCSGFIAGHPLAAFAAGGEAPAQAMQQTAEVSGVVKDASGMPVIGASV